MKKSQMLLGLIVAALLMTGSLADAALIGSYSFTGHALTPTDANALDGITFSNFVVGTGFGDLTDNSAPANALRISGDDGTPTGTGDAFTNDVVFSFTITVAAGWTLDLTSIEVDNQATNLFNYSFSRVYSSAQGTDDLTNDRIGLVGRNSTGSDASIETDTVNLDNPAANTDNGGNDSAADYNLTGLTSITFFLPWIDDSGVNTRYTDLHEVRINGVAVVPTPAALPAGAALLGLLAVRRRRSTKLTASRR